MTYTEKELDQFLHGISLSLLSKKSAQHWRYDEETAKEIEWLEALERKVRADKADRKTEPQYSEDDMYWLSLVEDVANGKMSDAGANQAWLEYINHKDEPTISKMEQVDEPQTELVRVKYHCINCAENGSYKCSKCDGEMYYKYDKDEPQTERSE